ncbi:flagellar hook-basal body complex protein FliE [Bradyrhizobium canariense]|uniref:Flagellar hook-basal body complex protein FliE n=1 Tax=Bradyrhizobium canariense TaxID=255045 RepID=A0A1H1MIK4_9BRAD|nr:flagellar hook-basal body complex protein FliE [Bradyrhizobium canariense]SDR86566.1 flagellar hook-basal body complex protein FliE [Bradyrhizobium canariense]
MASPTIAANAYANAARMMDPGVAAKSSGDAGGPSFGDLLKETMGSVIDGGRQADQQTTAMATGKANVMDVVTAVAETDVKISTLVSVRDKVISAYEDIMKMAI